MEMQTSEIRNPATNEIIGQSELHDAEHLKNAMASARLAQAEWARLPVSKRSRMLRRLLQTLLDEADQIAVRISLNSGKTRTDAMVTEVLASVLAVNYYTKNARRFLSDKKLKSGSLMLINKRSRIVRIPFGVVGIVSPWNYPFSIPFAEVIMALLAGNAVVLKTASETQLAGLEIKRLIESAGLPDGIFHFLNMPGRVAGPALLEVGVNKLFFTGSIPVGKLLMAKAAETLTPVSLELGGNDAMLVCEDADISRAVAGAVWAGFQNCGQSCGGVERVYVHEKVYQQFIDKLKTAVEQLTPGDPLDKSCMYGFMTTERQINTVRELVADAEQKGARVYARSPQGDNHSAHFLPATVLVDTNHTMRLMQEEIFGPVLGIMPVPDMEEAVRLANDSVYGLTGSIWSRNTGRARKLARKLQAGAITINDHLMSHGLHETPWGGFKQSSIGRTHGEIGFDEMTQPQVIIHDVIPFARRSIWYPPYSEKLYRGLLGAMDMLYAAKIPRRISGLMQLLPILPRIFRS